MRQTSVWGAASLAENRRISIVASTENSHPGLPITDFFVPQPLLQHADFRTQVVLQPVSDETGSAAARSWLGGMPEMPADQPWPEGPSGKMVFVAQICCSDLPRMLWGGIGPREGWLLLFLDALPVGGEPYSRILHVLERGPARHEGSEIEIDFLDRRHRASPGTAPALPHVPIELVARRTPTDLYAPVRPGEHSMGGLPTIGWDVPDQMRVSAYAPPALRSAWAQEYAYLNINPVDVQQVLLFQLATDGVAGWIWGDMGTALVIMPRPDLVQKRFDRAYLTIEGGG
ncbi:YwqG family protein [Devosia sp. ZB163]|uniref:YwqG family protein n=1 Tax=Devosia sp. ZB163 TaxID=3025938 RepID=UPI002360D368|nr:YwqG family protein [Devosia sp. ZB163]MDC9824006.1 YwqG family protein [Devosia sp. ZB163]